jgi:hypothetical protein
LYETIFFTSEGSISREMLYSEFEALLDGVVGLTELSNKTVKAIYALVDVDLSVTSAVFFLIGFNQKGQVEEAWNMPLRKLSEKGKLGPDLGAGNIRLSCRSQCAMGWLTNQLWEPDQGGMDWYSILKKTLRRNRLGLKTNSAIGGSALPPVLTHANYESSSTELDNDLIEKLKSKLSQVRAENNSLKRTLSGLDEKYTLIKQESEQAQQLRAKAQQRATAAEADNSQLRQDLEALHERLALMREEHLESLAGSQSAKAADSGLAERNAMLEQQVEVLRTKLEEQIDREMDLRAEFDDKLDAMAQDSSDQHLVFLEALAEKNTSLLVNENGLPPVTLPMERAEEFIARPEEVLAELYMVSVEQYKAWLEYRANPLCVECGAPLPNIHLKSFKIDISNRCALHQP